MGYIIYFPNHRGSGTDYYLGKTMMHNCEKYAIYCEKARAKIYKNKKVAENILDKLFSNCVNVESNAQVVELKD